MRQKGKMFLAFFAVPSSCKLGLLISLEGLLNAAFLVSLSLSLFPQRAITATCSLFLNELGLNSAGHSTSVQQAADVTRQCTNHKSPLLLLPLFAHDTLNTVFIANCVHICLYSHLWSSTDSYWSTKLPLFLTYSAPGTGSLPVAPPFTYRITQALICWIMPRV